MISPDSDFSGGEDDVTAPPAAVVKKEEPKRKDVEVCVCVFCAKAVYSHMVHQYRVH